MADGRYAAYLFDFDGTLADTDEINLRSAHAGLAAHGVEVEWEWISAEPLTTIDRLRQRLRLLPVDVPDGSFVAAAREYWLAHAEQVRAIPETVAVLREVAAAGPVAVVSDNDGQVVWTALASAGLAGVVGAVVAREHVRRLKPAPDSYLLAARLLGAEPTRCVAYENSDEGITAAGAAGMDVIDVRARARR